MKTLSKRARSADEGQAYLLSLNDESDKSVAMVGRSLLEEATEDLLVASMPGLDKQLRSELFRGTGPLATLSSRTKLAYALGVIGPITRRNIDLAREIGNAFAHSKQILTFETPEIAACCAHIELAQQSRSPEAFQGLRFTNRWKFATISVMLWAGLRQSSSISNRLRQIFP